MYKLVAVAGKIRGEEYELTDGENTIGREEECDHQISIQGVSKKHFSISVTEDVAYLKDLGSANGTFLNGKITKRATLKNGDKIALPDLILQVVHVKEKKVIIKQAAAVVDEEKEFLDSEEMPKEILGKAIWFFKYKVMSIVHGINQEYEWRILLAILLVVFIIINITLTIIPVLSKSKSILLLEISKRGAHYADEISRINATALVKNNLGSVNTTFLDREDGVDYFELFHIDGRLVRPETKKNEYTNDPFSVWARERFEQLGNYDRAIYKRLPDGKIGIAKQINAYKRETGQSQPVGIIAIKFAPTSLIAEAANSSRAYVESLITSMIVSIIFFGIIYFLTIRPIEELQFQTEEAMRGKRRVIEPSLLFSETFGLRETIYSILQRLREANDEDEGEFEDSEGDEKYVISLGEFLLGAGVPAMVLNSNKELSKINLVGEDLTGIRGNASEGVSLLDCAREKGFAATIIELCDDSSSNGGTNQEGSYELLGKEYEIHVVAMTDKSGYARAFYVTFIRDE